jgi:(R,R)-butanediol dehydrogenase / meso-butanediol dehydrogenase / diacetyl reductase
MRAAVYRGREDVVVDEVEEPACGPDHVKVKVAYNGICGTDLHEYYAGPIFIPAGEPHPLTGKAMPVILGHEFAGTVVEVGTNVTGVETGAKVTIEPVYRCDKCASCRDGMYNTCQQIGFHGLMADGGMAQYTVVEPRMLHRLPDSVSLELGALVEPMSVAYHAARLSEIGPGDSAVVFGAGPIGIGIWFGLRGLGVEDITVVEPSVVRREAIAGVGADPVIDPTKTDPATHMRQRTGGRGADAAFDAAGVPASVGSALESLGAHRKAIAVAIYERPINVELLKLVLNESAVQGSLCYTGDDYSAVIDLMGRGHYETKGWLSHIPLDQVVDDGFVPLHEGRKMKLLVDVQ